jgi:hypothetical protein
MSLGGSSIVPAVVDASCMTSGIGDSRRMSAARTAVAVAAAMKGGWSEGPGSLGFHLFNVALVESPLS